MKKRKVKIKKRLFNGKHPRIWRKSPYKIAFYCRLSLMQDPSPFIEVFEKKIEDLGPDFKVTKIVILVPLIPWGRWNRKHLLLFGEMKRDFIINLKKSKK
jgi:hypothetical protein